MCFNYRRQTLLRLQRLPNVHTMVQNKVVVRHELSVISFVNGTKFAGILPVKNSDWTNLRCRPLVGGKRTGPVR